MKILRLVLGDQLNPEHSWWKQTNDRITYLMAELKQESTYTVHHIQKIAGFFLSMRDFANHLRDSGHKVEYVKITDKETALTFEELILRRFKSHSYDLFEYQEPDEYRLADALGKLHKKIAVRTYDSEHFLTHKHHLSVAFGSKPLLMETFYRQLRQKKAYLIQGQNPKGGKWNYDSENRKKWKEKPVIPAPPLLRNEATEVLKDISTAGLQTIGVGKRFFEFPINRTQALRLLHHFCNKLLPYFGTFQDAMHSREPYLFHSRLSFALNLKMIHPDEVCRAIEEAYYTGQTDIAQA